MSTGKVNSTKNETVLEWTLTDLNRTVVLQLHDVDGVVHSPAVLIELNVSS